MDRREFLASGSFALLAAAFPRLAWVDSENSADLKLRAAVDRIFDRLVDNSPEMATSLGLDKGKRAALKSKLDGYSKADQTRLLAEGKTWLAEVKAIDRKALSPSAALNYDVVTYMLNQNVAGGDKYGYGTSMGYYVPYSISQLSGSYQNVPAFLDSQHTIETKADADAYLARLAEFPRTLDDNTEFQKADAAQGVFAPDFCLDLALAQLKSLRDIPAAKTVLVESIVRRAKEKNIAGDYGARAEKLVADKVFPALDRQIALVKELRAKAKHDAGCWRLPKGDEYYADALINQTTTTLKPAEVHQLGLQQVADISGQIDKILKAQGLSTGSVGDRLTTLNKDPKQLFPNTDDGRAQLIAHINTLVKEIDAKLPQAFATLPKAKLEIKRVPPFIQDGAPNGYYANAALDGSRGAIYYINLKDTHEWPRYGLPALTHHEGAPGHHLQISLSQEAKDLPMLRKVAPFGAYTEGWALYAEQLADELGIYKSDPIGRAGHLQSLLFRAVRLVVDTGLHFKRWSREQATDYMVKATGFPQARVQREIDRYCIWPGQACSYKVGHNSWVKARDKVKALQGAKFDLKQFHRVLLEGALPLSIMENLTEARARKA